MKKLIWFIIDLRKAMKERKEQKQHQKGQIPHIQQLLESDLKTFHDMPIIRAILERYTEAASPEWYKKGHYLGDVYRAKVMKDTAKERIAISSNKFPPNKTTKVG